jgi:hypothetical protein
VAQDDDLRVLGAVGAGEQVEPAEQAQHLCRANSHMGSELVFSVPVRLLSGTR